ncbi:universal stress protein [Flavobacterium cellulosilyticum]|uniref:Universal stress protein n=1 Tax=Flavobacterium cellulosilyticum TaxID=2541731 RepID=A0A4R5CGY4_9FLAO|nr:universal stress protein [Flavobacterium cellulosilyticum]TDD96554.1 universal stress protein [Flavobacterium cellulosilyticum]
MKRILIPIDFSEYSDEAIKVGAKIAKTNNCEIVLLHILELPHQTSDVFGAGNSIPEIMFYKESMINKLDELMDIDELKGLTVSRAFEFEKVAEGIIDSSTINNVDLIVMGSKGVTGLEELLIGSNTEKVVRLSTIPVLVIKKTNREFKTQNFVFASDFSEDTKEAFKKMLDFAVFFKSNLFLVIICTPYNFKSTQIAEKIIHDYIADFEIDNYSTHVYNDVTVEKGILNFANTIDADLIGICTHGRTGLSHFLNGSIGEDIANHSITPLITFRI